MESQGVEPLDSGQDAVDVGHDPFVRDASRSAEWLQRRRQKVVRPQQIDRGRGGCRTRLPTETGPMERQLSLAQEIGNLINVVTSALRAHRRLLGPADVGTRPGGED